MKQNKQHGEALPKETPFSLREGFAVGVGFFGYFFAIKKVIKINFLGVSRQKISNLFNFFVLSSITPVIRKNYAPNYNQNREHYQRR